MKLDITKLTIATDELIATTKNSRHRAILENYRLHAFFEVTGRWQGIFAPEMTVPEPVYRVHSGTGVDTLRGKKEVQALYQSYVEANSSVIILTDEKLCVDDWGFASEAVQNRIFPGKALLENGDAIDDPKAWYLTRRTTAMFWHYDEECRLIGENVYRGGDRIIRKLAPEEVITRDEIYESLLPIYPKLSPIKERLVAV
jgi:hypothetical protein